VKHSSGPDDPPLTNEQIEAHDETNKTLTISWAKGHSFHQKHKQADLDLQINSSQVIDSSPEICRAAPLVNAAYFVGISEAYKG
jgi:hypothetical protein